MIIRRAERYEAARDGRQIFVNGETVTDYPAFRSAAEELVL